MVRKDSMHDPDGVNRRILTPEHSIVTLAELVW